MEINTPTAPQQATTQIRYMILNGEFQPGDPVCQNMLVAVITPYLVCDLFDMRNALEPMAFRAAFPVLTKLDLARGEMVLDSETLESTPAELSELNWAFHSALYAPCERKLLMQ